MKVVKLTYFKPSGKYYSEGKYVSDEELDYEIYKEVRYWYLSEIPLPELSTEFWNGYILVVPDDGVPVLIDLCNEK